MLFYFNNKVIFNKIFYDEPSSILMVFYSSRKIIEYFKVDRVFFYKYVLQYIEKQQDFRQILYWGINKHLVYKLSSKHPDIEMIKLNHLSIYDK